MVYMSQLSFSADLFALFFQMSNQHLYVYLSLPRYQPLYFFKGIPVVLHHVEIELVIRPQVIVTEGY